MRRGEKASGVIRPRTLGLGKVVTAPEPIPPPPPPTPAPQFFHNRKVRMALLVGFLFVCVLYWSKGGQESNHPLLGSHDLPESPALRSNPLLNDQDDVEEEQEEGNSAPSIKKKPINKHDDDEEEDDEDSSSQKKEEEEEDEPSEATSDEGVEHNNEDAQTNVNERSTSSQGTRTITPGDDNKDRSKTVESYFVNFGGRVVDIDREGSYKYVLVRMEDIFGNQALLVRGCPHKEGTHCKHNDAFSRAKTELELRGFRATVLGGGRITRHPSRHQKGQKEGYISVFGYSKTFGACEDCNKLACALIKGTLSDHGVKWANEGYLESDERKIRDDAWTRC